MLTTVIRTIRLPKAEFYLLGVHVISRNISWVNCGKYSDLRVNYSYWTAENRQQWEDKPIYVNKPNLISAGWNMVSCITSNIKIFTGENTLSVGETLVDKRPMVSPISLSGAMRTGWIALTLYGGWNHFRMEAKKGIPSVVE